MPSSHRPPPPPFPYPPSAPAGIPVPNGANNYLTVGHGQDYGRSPQVGRSPRTIPPPLLPPSEPLPSQYQSTYPPTSQHTLVSGRHHPAAFPTPPVHSTHARTAHFTQPQVPPRAPTTHSEPPSRMQRSVTMPTPGFSSDPQLARGHYPSSALQAPIMSPSQSHSGMSGVTRIPSNRRRNQDDSDDERVWDDHDTSVTHRNGTIPKGRPNRPLVGMLNPPNRPAGGAHGSANGTFARLLNRMHLGSQPSSSNQIQTQAAPPAPVMPPPQPVTFRCRWHECQLGTNISGDIAARYSGFCCSGHRSLGIRHGIVRLCSRCREQVCPDGLAFCSAGCANGSGLR